MERSIQLFILNDVRTQLLSAITDCPSPESLTEQELLLRLFSNYRYRNGYHYGMRLSPLGNRILKKEFEHHIYEHSERLSNIILLELDKNMTMPYYIDSVNVIFYSDMDAAWYKMNGGSLSGYTDYI